MANLKEIRTRIVSVQGTRQITSAMKMVSAAKLRKAQDAIIQMRPYAVKLQEILGNLSESLENDHDNVYTVERDIKRVLILAISSNKGLCGAFNSNIVKKTIELMTKHYWQQKRESQVDVISVGKKGTDLLHSREIKVLESHNEILDSLDFTDVAKLASKIMDWFADGTYDEVQIVYNQFKNAAIQELKIEQFLPILPAVTSYQDQIHADYILEPSKEAIVKDLIPKSLKIQLFKTLLDSNASEHGARMTAMHKATDNASELIKALQLEYNKARQAAITTEILEIVGGAEALKG
ncbi:MAG: ATP synthase F1 subunit gamma [Bacteroidales bacterium]|nr:ATP synthase F1 subunit gamma [Bacteroidales bacterium]